MRIPILSALPLALAALVLSVSERAAAQIALGTNSQISVSTASGAPDGPSDSAQAASNGRFIAFRSDATNLVSGDRNAKSDIFVRDTKNSSLIRVSTNSQGQEGDGDSREPSISPVGPDGFYTVVFSSDASNFGRAPMPNSFRRIIFRAPTLRLSAIVSFGVGPSDVDGDSEDPSVTIIPAPNRILLAYSSAATNLVSDDTNGFKDVFFATIRRPDEAASSNFPDLVTTTMISRGADGAISNGDSTEPAISGDGRFIVFSSLSSNLLAGQTISHSQVYLYDIQKSSLSLVSKNADGVPGDFDSSEPTVSYNGRYVVYATEATNIIDDSFTGRKALVLYDTQTGETSRMNASAEGTAGDGSASRGTISPNGRFVIFSDTSSNLVSGDTNGVADIFIKDIETGEIMRASNGTAAESDGASDGATFGGASFNSPVGLLAFRSDATNLTDQSPSQLSGQGDVFLNRIDLPRPTLTRDTQLEVPADVAIRNSNNVRVTAQAFGSVDISSDVGQGTIPTDLVGPAATSTVKYDVRVNGTGSVKNERFRKVSKRNRVTFRNLKSGTYTTRYRAITVQGSSTVSRTSFSPRQRFQVN